MTQPTPTTEPKSRIGRIVARVVGFLACALVIAGLAAELWLFVMRAKFGGSNIDPRDLWDW